MRNRLFHALTIKPFLFLWLAEIFSQIAVNMMNFVLLVIAFDLTHSNTAVSGIILATTLPAVFFGLFAGVYVDRRDKKKILLATNIIRGFLLLLLIPFHTNLALIYLLTIIISVVTQFFLPAETPMIPLLVRKDLLLSANALFGIGVYGSILFAYALSGPLLIFLGRSDIFIVLAVMFFLAGLFVTLIKNHKYDNDKSFIGEIEPLNFREEIKKSFVLISKTKKIYDSLVLLALSQMLILIVGVIGPGYATQVLGISVEKFPLLFVTPAAFGMILGAIAVDYFSHKISKQKCATTGVFLAGLGVTLMPFVPFMSFGIFFSPQIEIIFFMFVVAFILGFSNALVFVPSNTVVQEETSNAFRGKIYGALNSLIGLFSLFPIIMIGGFADLFGVAKVLTGIGIAIVLFGISRVILK